MSVRPIHVGLLAAALAAACSRSDSGGAPVLASSRIGPAGGVLTVDDGPQEGLVLTIPAGVLSEETQFRIIDESYTLPPELQPTSYLAPAGFPFRIEPADLVMPINATLLLPYLSANLMGEQPPGNVSVYQVSPYTEREYEPVSVDVDRATVEVGIKTFGSFRVVRGPRVDDLFEYLPPRDEVQVLEGGVRFVIEDVPASSPFAAQAGSRWSIEGPGIAEALVFVDYDIVGRVALNEAWRELWSTPLTPFEPFDARRWVTMSTMQVQTPANNPASLGAGLTFYGYMDWGMPLEFDGRQLRDVMILEVDIGYDRADIGAGARRLRVRFAPGAGLLAVAIDEVEHERIP